MGKCPYVNMVRKIQNVWKLIAIIFIVLFILETIGVIYVTNVGLNVINNEKECSYNTCKDYDAYYFDSYEGICYCYRGTEITKQEFIK